MTYLLVLSVRFYRDAGGIVATESSFLEHLRLTRRIMQPMFYQLLVAAPGMSDEEYESSREHLGHFVESAEGIHWTRLRGVNSGRFTFLARHFLSVARTVLQLVRRSDLVHAGISMDTYKPYEVLSLIFGALLGKKTIFVVDIDERTTFKKLREAGTISFKSYWINRILHDPLRSAQIRWAVAHCSLVLLKGESLVADFGKCLYHVKNFFDVSYFSSQVISDARLKKKLSGILHDGRTLELVYFGRLVRYKGVDNCIRAVARACAQGANARLTIIGDGPERGALQALTAQLDSSPFVTFRKPIRFGQALFDELYRFHVLLATPTAPDTPRSVFDAMAAGCAVLAYDTDYYRSIRSTGAVELTPIDDWESVGNRICGLSDDPTILERRITAAVEFARDNSQEAWMARRANWVGALFD